MGLFGNSSIVGPPIEDVKVTFENMCITLGEPIYDRGVDSDGVINMISDLYRYISGNKNMKIRCPAPADDPDDCHRIMWPEGAKVRSRTSSVSSRSTSYRQSVTRLSDQYANRHSREKSAQKARDYASSVTSSSRYGSRYVGIVDEELPESPLVSNGVVSMLSASRDARGEHSKSSRVKIKQPPSSSSRNTLRVSGAVIKPSESLERIAGENNQGEDEDETPNNPPARQQRRERRERPSKAIFADDQ